MANIALLIKHLKAYMNKKGADDKYVHDDTFRRVLFKKIGAYAQFFHDSGNSSDSSLLLEKLLEVFDEKICNAHPDLKSVIDVLKVNLGARWAEQVDNFDNIETLPEKDREKAKTKQEHAQRCLKKVLSIAEAKNALYEGIERNTITGEPNKPQRKARNAFLDYLQDTTLLKHSPLAPPNVERTTLKELLGEKGFALFLDAQAEELQSIKFRDAIMQRATNHYDGKKFAKRVIAPYGGPSAAGKSVSQPALVKTITPYIPTIEGDNSGNDFVSVDGGVEREISQVTGMTLQIASALGYDGISDLYDYKPKGAPKMKELVEEAALATPGLNIIIPKTYVNELQKLFWAGKKDLQEYDKVDGGTAIVVFGIVEAEQGNVRKNGSARAWNSKSFTVGEILMNLKPPCESKAPDDNYTYGTNFSHIALSNYNGLGDHPHKPRIVVKVTSDYTFIKPDPTDLGGWVIAGEDEKWDKSMLGIVQSDFEAYQEFIGTVSRAGEPDRKKEIIRQGYGGNEENIHGWLKNNAKWQTIIDVEVKAPQLEKGNIYIEYSPDDPVGWKEAVINNKDKTWNPNMVPIARADFESFKKYKNENRSTGQDLKTWLEARIQQAPPTELTKTRSFSGIKRKNTPQTLTQPKESDRTKLTQSDDPAAHQIAQDRKVTQNEIAKEAARRLAAKAASASSLPPAIPPRTPPPIPPRDAPKTASSSLPPPIPPRRDKDPLLSSPQTRREPIIPSNNHKQPDATKKTSPSTPGPTPQPPRFK